MAAAVYIFRTHKGWTHCGGLLVVIAKGIEHAEDLVKQWGKETGCQDEIRRIAETDDDGEAIGTWVLEEIVSKDGLAVMGDDECKVVSASWNYA